MASTSQMWNPVAGTWDLELLRQMGMDAGLFGAMTDSGSIIGALPDMDADMRELAKRTLSKVDALTEAEFAELPI